MVEHRLFQIYLRSKNLKYDSQYLELFRRTHIDALKTVNLYEITPLQWLKLFLVNPLLIFQSKPIGQYETLLKHQTMEQLFIRCVNHLCKKGACEVLTNMIDTAEYCLLEYREYCNTSHQQAVEFTGSFALKLIDEHFPQLRVMLV